MDEVKWLHARKYRHRPEAVPLWCYFAFIGVLAAFVRMNVTGPGQEVASDGHSYVTFPHGMIHGFGLTLMVVAPIMATLAIFEKRGLNWFLINTGYWLVTLMLMGGFLSAWR